MERDPIVGFGGFQFDPSRSLLTRDGAPVAIGQRCAALLAALLARRGEVVDKSDLMEAAWPGVTVEEANLSVQIGLLRKALGRTPAGGEWITTVSRIGYRFVPAVAGTASAMRFPTLAVLSFSDLGTGAQLEADGLAQDLTIALSRFKSLTVLARAAGRNSADYQLQGSLRKIGQQRRVSVQLIDNRTNAHLWAESFDFAPAPGKADHAIHRIAAMVEPQIENAEAARSLIEHAEGEGVYDLYVRARRLLRTCAEPDNARAFVLAQQALRMEPENIHLVALACWALHHRVAMGWPDLTADDRRGALDFANQGMALGTDDAGALGILSHGMFVAREWDIARLTMERAVAANPHSSLALTCAGQGALFLADTDLAERYYLRAFELGPWDPNRAHTLNGLAVVARRRGQFDTAIELAKSALAIKPNFGGSHWQLITASAYSGRLDEARRHVARYRAVSPGSTVTSVGEGQPIVDRRLLNHLLEGLAEAGLPEA